ncbi:MAG: putative rane protein [Herbinix sp.]|nr:putative rane protein [Herbinix sp.]
MSKKSIFGLLLFSLVIVTAMFIGVNYMIKQGHKADENQNLPADNDLTEDAGDHSSSNEVLEGNNISNADIEITDAEPWLNTNPSDVGEEQQADSPQGTENSSIEDGGSDQPGDDVTEHNGNLNASGAEDNINNPGDKDSTSNPADIEGNDDETASTDVLGGFVNDNSGLQLIYDCDDVDYMSYIPEMNIDDQIKKTLDINNPDLSITAKAAILFDADTKEVLYYKNAVEPIFPASTAKLLTSLVALDWCSLDEQITVGDEITLKATDASTAYLNQGDVLTLRNLLEAILLPSGNDAAFVAAAYIGRKSLKNPNAPKVDAVVEFSRMMNEKAAELGVKNSCFKTPDGYDAIGQYTTAYDMGMIGLAAVGNETICDIVKKSKSRNVFVSGEDVTWYNTNDLISKNSGRYYPYAIGLKTGTSTMAGKCLISAARKDGKEVLCVIMNSDSSGRWEDSADLLKYGLQQ